MLVSVGERISCALAAMVIHDLGHEAISLTGSQAGIVTDTVHGKAKIVEVRARRIHEALDEGTIVLVAGFQGVSTSIASTLGRGGSDTTAVALAGRARRRLLRDLHRRQRGLPADPRLVPNAQAADAASASTRCSRWPRPAPASSPPARSRSRAVRVRLHVRSSFEEGDGTWIQEEDVEMLEGSDQRRRAPARGDRLPGRRREAGAALRRARGRVGQRGPIVQTTRDRLLGSGRGQGGRGRTLDGLGLSWSARDDLGKVSLSARG